MAQRKKETHIEGGGNYWTVWTDHNVELAERAQLIPGVRRADWLKGSTCISIDPRYDEEEVMAEVRQLIDRLGEAATTITCPMCGGTGQIEAQ